MKKILKQFVFLVFLLALTTCSETGIKLNSSNKVIPTNDAAIKFNGDFLEFASPKDFNEIFHLLVKVIHLQKLF